MRIWLALSLQFRATLASTIFSQLPGKKMMGLVTSKFNPASNNSNQCNSNIISMDGNSSWVGNKFSKTLTKLRMWWTCTTNILILLPLLINTMRSTLWLVSEVNKKKWSNNKRPTCRCNKCKWCSNSSNNSKCNSLTLVASHLNSSTARCSSNSKTYRSMQELWTCKTKCNNSNSNRSGLHSSNKTLVAILRIHRPMPLSSHKQMQEVSETSARSNLLLRIMIVTKVSTTVVLSTWAQDSVMKLLPLLVNNSSHHLVMLTSRTLSNGEDKVG